MSQNKTYYITTPIYYPSGKWHLGTCYTTVVCDALARFKRMQGYDVFYLTGTDEHGQKIEKKANEEGIEVMKYLDQQIASLKKVWDLYDISYNKFIRTTDAEHTSAVQKIFKKLYDQGDIYKSEYEGWYCVPCESFWTKTQAVDGKCPDCGRPVERTKEVSYFFRLSKYQDRLLDLIQNNPDFLEPKSRQNEMINNFLKPGLQDLCVSRTSFKWGIPVDFDPDHIVYVWIDALTNYITALGYGSADDTLFKKYWPADVHMMAKEIVRFHSIIWPALLMALDLPLPKKVYGHGWLLFGADKMSKSKGNVIDPIVLADRYGVDAIRYYLLREVPFGQDGNYTNYLLLNRLNSDLANTLGNLINRTVAMIGQYFDGIIPAPVTKDPIDAEIISMSEALLDKVTECMDRLNVPDALTEIFALIQRANKYVDETTPWVLYKDKNIDRLKTVMYNLAEVIRVSAVLLQSYLTKAPKKILEAFNVAEKFTTFDSVKKFGGTVAGTVVNKIPPIFPRIDINKELAELDKLVEAKAEKKVETEEKTEKAAVQKAEIDIEEFAKTQLTVGKVLAAEKVEKSDKLLKLTVEVGDKTRTIVSGIAKFYTAEEMVNKKVVIVANLKPVKLKGILSEGMILCAEDKDGNLSIVSPEKEISSGSEVR